MNTYEIDYLSAKPADWETKKFRQVFDFFKGLSITKDNLLEEGIPVISYGQVHSKDNSGFGLCDALYRFVSKDYLYTDKKCLVKPGDFIFADTSEDYAGVGNCAYIDRNEPIFAGYHSIVARPSETENYYGKYFAFLFMTDFWRSQIRAEVMGIKVFSITQKLLRNTVVIVPPVAEQQAIADFLDDKCSQIDGIIADIEKQIEILKSYKKSLITETVTKGLDKTAKMKDSGVEWIGQIPEHWDVKRLKYLIKIKDGTHDTPNYVEPSETTYKFITPKVIDYELKNIDFENAKHVSEKDFYEIYKRSDVKKNDIIMPMIGTIGNPVIVETDEKFAIKNVALFKTCNDAIMAKNIFYQFYSDVVLEQFGSMARGGVQTFVSLEILGNLYVIDIPCEHMKLIVNYLDAKCQKLDSIITTKQTQLTKMQQHKKSLIYEYVTGKKRVAI